MSNDFVENTILASELGEDWFSAMADLIIARCSPSFTASDKQIVDKYREALVKGVDEDGNHLDLIVLNEKTPSQIVNELRNINNHRSRATNIISNLEVAFFSPYDEVELAK